MNDTTRNYHLQYLQHLQHLQAFDQVMVVPAPRDEVRYFYNHMLNDATREIVSLEELRAFIHMRPRPNLISHMRANYSIHQQPRRSPHDLNDLAAIYALCLVHTANPHMSAHEFEQIRFNIRFTYRFDNLAQGLINRLRLSPKHVLLGLGLLANYATLALDLLCIFSQSSDNVNLPDDRFEYHVKISAMILPALILGQLLLFKDLDPEIDGTKELALFRIDTENSTDYRQYAALLKEVVAELKGEKPPHFFDTTHLASMRRFIEGGKYVAAPAIGYLGFFSSPLWVTSALAALPLTLEACLAAEAGFVDVVKPSPVTKFIYSATVWAAFLGVFMPVYNSDALHEEIKSNVYCDDKDQCFTNAIHTPLAFTLGAMAAVAVDYAALKLIHHAPPLDSCVQSVRQAAEQCRTGVSRLCVSLFNHMRGGVPVDQAMQNIELGPFIRQSY